MRVNITITKTYELDIDEDSEIFADYENQDEMIEDLVYNDVRGYEHLGVYVVDSSITEIESTPLEPSPF